MSLAARRAAALARKSPAPSTDAAELVESYRPVPVEPADPVVAVVAPTLAPVDSFDDLPLRGRPVAVVDTETTGLDPATSHIVEVAVVVVDELGGDGDPYVALSTRVRPPVPIPADATKVHGISDADVADAPTWVEVWPRIRELLVGRMPCAFNAPFDFRMVAAENRRLGIVSEGPGAWGGWLDPMVLVRGLDRFEKGKRLRDAAARRGITVDPHGAAGDAMVTAMVLLPLIRESVQGRTDRNGMVTFRSPPRPTVGAWLAWQRGQALDQERDLVAYMAKLGRRDPVDCPWHELESVELRRPEPPPVPTTDCKSCRAPIVWVVTSAGKRIPLDPPVLRAMPVDQVNEIRAKDIRIPSPGRLVALTTDEGRTALGHLHPEGELVGREAHHASCPNAARHRT